MDISLAEVLALAAVAATAGFVDAIAGGGGLLTLPALLAAGLPPETALGTNKGQSVWGSGAALLSYARSGLVKRERAPHHFLLGLSGAACGASLLFLVPREWLRPIVLALLVAVAAFLAFRPRFDAASAETRKLRPDAVAVLAFAIAAYDGFFGPGTGTFLILAFVFFAGRTASAASADAKVVNFASNFASCAIFAASGWIVWSVALPMAAGQILGATLGTRMVLRRGDGIVRRAVFLVVVATCAKLAYDLWG